LAPSAHGDGNRLHTTVIASVVVESGRTTDVSVDLQVGTTSETVRFGDRRQLNTTTTEVGGTINNSWSRTCPAGRDGLGFAGLIAAIREAIISGTARTMAAQCLAQHYADGADNSSQRFKSGGTSFRSLRRALMPSRVSVRPQAWARILAAKCHHRSLTTDMTFICHGRLSGENEAPTPAVFRNMRGLPRNIVRSHNVATALGRPLLRSFRA
jgi:hypothetical protein